MNDICEKIDLQSKLILANLPLSDDGVTYQVGMAEQQTQQIQLLLHNSSNTLVHSHPYVQLIINIGKTPGKVVIDKHVFQLDQYGAFLIGRGTAHKIENVVNQQLLLINATNTYFIPERLAALTLDNYQNSFLLPLLAFDSGHPTWVAFKTQVQSDWLNCIQTLVNNYQHTSEIDQMILGHEYLVLMLTLLKAPHEYQSFSEAAGKVSTISLCHYIERHYRKISLTKMAAVFGYHPNYLNRKLKNNTGQSYSELVALQRINTACRLIKITNAPIVEVANLVGYSNLESFYKKFRELTGVNPNYWHHNA